MGSSLAGGERCMEGSGGGMAAGRRGGKKVAEQHKVDKQPQRGLGVAQLEKIRLHNQMVAAFRSAGGGGLHDDAPSPPPPPPPPPFAAPTAMAASPFHQPYLTDCYESMDHQRIAGVQPYYEGMAPYGSSRLAAVAPSPAFVAYEVKGDQYGSSGQRQPQQYYSWMSSSYDHSGGRSSAGSSSEELDLELRL